MLGHVTYRQGEQDQRWYWTYTAANNEKIAREHQQNILGEDIGYASEADARNGFMSMVEDFAEVTIQALHKEMLADGTLILAVRQHLEKNGVSGSPQELNGIPPTKGKTPS